MKIKDSTRAFFKEVKSRVDISLWHDFDSFSVTPMNWRDFTVVALQLETSSSKTLELHTGLFGFHLIVTIWSKSNCYHD